MTAHVRNGRIELDEPAELPEGAAYELRPLEKNDQDLPNALEHVGPWIGSATGLPSDLAANHDHYIHGRPLR